MKLAARPRGVEKRGPNGALHWTTLARFAAVFSLLGAGVIHAAQIRTHLEEWPAAGFTFIALAVIQIGLGAVLAFIAWRPLMVAAVEVSVLIISLWGVSRLIGLPVGPNRGIPEEVRRADVVATSLEFVTVVAVLCLLLFGSRPDQRPLSLRWRGSVLLTVMAAAVAAVTFFGLQPSGWLCAGHGGSDSPTGPIVPVDGHSMLPRGAPQVTVRTGDRFGLVVGLVWNCSDSPATLKSGRIVTEVGDSARSGRFWLVPSALARPGMAIAPAELRRRGKPVSLQPLVQPNETSRSLPGLVVEGAAVKPGLYYIHALEVSYASGDAPYQGRYATNASVVVSASRGDR
ncbi:MAG: hypothetical protein M3N24_10820 [Actinomycetota bacterium]|nr:hypothetical protein [Actinomycetota bacterium]